MATETRTFPELFQQTLRRYPGQIAVASARTGLQVSYASLDRRAAVIAATLAGAGAGPGAYVGLSLTSRANFCAALLATWRCGATPVPVDAHAPVSYIRALSRAVPLAITVTDGGAARGTVVDLRALPPGRAGAGPAWQPARGAAYVMHTSGSTGFPKGVIVAHDALGSYCAAFASAIGLTGADRFLQMAPMTFDVVFEELLPVWAAGGTAVLAEPRAPDPARFVGEITAGGVTVAEITTAYWSLLVRCLERSETTVPGCLRLLIVGGELAPRDLLTRSARLGLPIAHVYGVTEATITSAIATFPDGPPPAAVPVGTPISNTTLHVAGPGGEPVPDGQPGEIWITGPCLADGYAGDAGLTARRFVHADGPVLPPGRYYRTGDRGRWLADGTLEVLGRIDEQVKVKGIRVEPAGVQARLAEVPGVAAAAVIAAGDSPGTRRLAAFIVADREIPAHELEQHARSHLAGCLPAHEVPASLTVIRELPLTRHGKVDHSRLRELHQADSRASRPDTTAAESAVTAAWSAALGHRPASAQESFFDAGGDSLAVLEAVARLQGQGYPVTAEDFARWPTVAELAAFLDGDRDDTAAASLAAAQEREQARRRARKAGQS